MELTKVNTLEMTKPAVSTAGCKNDGAEGGI
jgi:hypothetical protein